MLRVTRGREPLFDVCDRDTVQGFRRNEAVSVSGGDKARSFFKAFALRSPPHPKALPSYQLVAAFVHSVFRYCLDLQTISPVVTLPPVILRTVASSSPSVLWFSPPILPTFTFPTGPAAVASSSDISGLEIHLVAVVDRVDLSRAGADFTV